MEMEDDQQYGIPDFRQYMNGRQLFPLIPPPPTDILAGHRQHCEMAMLGPHQITDHNMLMPHGGGVVHQHEFGSDSTATSNGGLEMESGGTGRWPRQETLTLLEIRSRLDFKFKEANHKGPLWDEISRIMYEEYGYQRSGKKCREKFDNLYKYYKKTKEGKAGRQDGKHYRFFRQLEALYGETSINPPSVSETNLLQNHFQYNPTTEMPNQRPFIQAPNLTDSLSLSDSFQFETSSSDGTDFNDSSKKRTGKKSSWKVKIKEFMDVQMKKLIEKQECWMEKIMSTIENKEKERVLREEEWRKQEVERVEREHEFWARERARIEARDTALMDALGRLTGKELKVPTNDYVHDFQSFGENQTDNGIETAKRKKHSRNFCYEEGNYSNETASDQGLETISLAPNVLGSASISSNTRNDDGCIRLLMGDSDKFLWQNYGMKLTKEENH